MWIVLLRKDHPPGQAVLESEFITPYPGPGTFSCREMQPASLGNCHNLSVQILSYKVAIEGTSQEITEPEDSQSLLLRCSAKEWGGMGHHYQQHPLPHFPHHRGTSELGQITQRNGGQLSPRCPQNPAQVLTRPNHPPFNLFF